MADESIAIIHVKSQKADIAGPPRVTWVSSRFQLYLAHSDVYCDKVVVLSDKYGLISPDDEIEPYDANVSYATIADQLRWWGRMKQAIKKLCETKPKVVVLYIGNYERERIVREFVRNGVRNVVFPFENAGISERIQLIYDMEPPFDEEKLAAGDYELPENYGAPKKRGRPAKAEADKLPTSEADIEFVDDDEDDEVTEAE